MSDAALALVLVLLDSLCYRFNGTANWSRRHRRHFRLRFPSEERLTVMGAWSLHDAALE